MEQNKTLQLVKKNTTENQTNNNNYPGIRSLFREPINLYQPESQSSGIFTKKYDISRYK